MTKPLINEALRVVRLYWGKTQSELAGLLGISQGYVSDIEKGNREVTLDLLGRYSRALGIPMSSLMLFAEQMEGGPPVARGKLLLAGKALNFLKRIMPDDLDKAG